jgi:hypothetical protein
MGRLEADHDREAQYRWHIPPPEMVLRVASGLGKSRFYSTAEDPDTAGFWVQAGKPECPSSIICALYPPLSVGT